MRLPVAIVGQAWRTPLGTRVDEVVSKLLAGERVVIASPRAAGYACKLVAPIPDEPARSRQSRFLRRMGLFGLEVAQEAFANAKASAPAQLVEGNRVGLFAGVGGLRAHWDDMLKALEHQADDGTNAWERGLRDVHPYWMLRHLSNNVHALAAMELGLKGEGATYGGATGGAQALAAAARALHDGAIDAALVLTYDSLLEPETLVELGARRAATQEIDPSQVAPPYDPRAGGFVPGEAAAALVLVRVDDAPSLARVATCDGADGERAEPRPASLLSTARGLLDAGVPLAFVDGAARAWPDRDTAERAMLAELALADTPLTAITASLGQLGAATTVVQAIALAELLRRGSAPPIAPSTASTPITGRTALALSTGAPGLTAAVHVEVR
jgi:3-oxoacyl-[acyl-carrier-protein] synthase II